MGSIGEKFARNPGAWILGGLLIFSFVAHYRTGAEFTRACEHAEAMFQGWHLETIYANNDAKRLQQICERRLAEPEPFDE